MSAILAVAAEDRVRERFGERDGDVQRQLARRVGKLRALPRDHLDDVLDVADVARDLELDGQAHVLEREGFRRLEWARSRFLRCAARPPA